MVHRAHSPGLDTQQALCTAVSRMTALRKTIVYHLLVSLVHLANKVIPSWPDNHH